MAPKTLKFFNFSNLVLIAGLISAPAMAAEKYAATVEDGTAKVIKASTKVDDDAPAAAPRKIVRKAKTAAVKPATKTVSGQLAELARQNQELQKRLAALEEVRAEKKAEDSAEAASGNVDATDEAAQQNDVAGAPGVELSSDEVTDSADAPQATPAPKAAPEKPAKATAKKAAADAEKVSAIAKTEAKPAAEPAPRSYDAVPKDRISDLAQRLKYTNEILKRFGRAYDYRVTTLKEFKKILIELEAAENTEASN